MFVLMVFVVGTIVYETRIVHVEKHYHGIPSASLKRSYSMPYGKIVDQCISRFQFWKDNVRRVLVTQSVHIVVGILVILEVDDGVEVALREIIVVLVGIIIGIAGSGWFEIKEPTSGEIIVQSNVDRVHIRIGVGNQGVSRTVGGIFPVKDPMEFRQSIRRFVGEQYPIQFLVALASNEFRKFWYEGFEFLKDFRVTHSSVFVDHIDSLAVVILAVLVL
mmetsp:Transcript_8125/g.19973  ORF Transcript_8125/g.19973 Transcript_8125/m.19973 type:complete len:219 (-) Transcript_8125:340-996(-)